MILLLLILSGLFFGGCLLEAFAPDPFNFEAVIWAGLILIIVWAVVEARPNRKVVGQGAYRTGQLG